jgi:hypothetical protein
VPLTPLT